MSAILTSKKIGAVAVDVIIREDHRSSLGLPKEPIETGAEVTDHAYIEPKRLVLEFADSKAAVTWQALVRVQESRVPFSVVTGLMIYKDMMIAELTAPRDARTSRIVRGEAVLEEVLRVSTATTTGSPEPTKAADDATKDKTTGTTTRGDQPTKPVEPPRNQSIMRRMFPKPTTVPQVGQGPRGDT